MKPGKLKISVKEEFVSLLARSLWDGENEESGEDNMFVYPRTIKEVTELILSFIRDNDFEVRRKS